MAGRPPYYDTSEELININTAKSLFNGDDFKNERELCDFIEFNIELFCKGCLGVELKSYTREYPIQTNGRSHKQSKGIRRVDFYIISKCGLSIAVECKHPTYAHSELSASVGQALSYISIFKEYKTPIDKMFIVSSKSDYIIPQMIKDFNLPLEFVCINKKQSIILQTNLLFNN